MHRTKLSGLFGLGHPNALSPRGMLDLPPLPDNAMARGAFAPPPTPRNATANALGTLRRHRNALADALIDPDSIIADRDRRVAWVNTAGSIHVLSCIDARGCVLQRDAKDGEPGRWDCDHTVPGWDVEHNLRALNSSSNRSEGARPWLRW